MLAQFTAEVAVEAAFSFMADPPHEYVRIAIVEVLAIGVPLLLYAYSARNTSEKGVKYEFGLNRCSLVQMLLAALIGICGQFVMILLNLPMNLLFQSSSDAAVSVAMDEPPLVLGIIAVAVIPAILEEFWMRGVIFSVYNRSNTVAAIFFTSLMFAFLHMNLNDIFGFIFMGIVASVVMIKCHSLYAAMIYHGFSNLTALLLGNVILPYIADNVWLVFGLMTVMFVVLFALLLMQKNKAKINRVFKPGNLVVNSIISLPVILSFVVALIKFLVAS